jgi:2,5-diketo-D-gluconate reductase B
MTAAGVGTERPSRSSDALTCLPRTRYSSSMKSLQGIPVLGFGTWPLKGQQCFESVRTALALGYRHIDTADGYANHREVGQAIRDSGVTREEIFLTTKVRRNDLRRDDVIAACERFLAELQTDYLDLALIHWPNNDIPMAETFAGFQELKDRGVVRNFGVSNFTIARLERAGAITDGIIVDQVEYHPSLNQQSLLDYCQSRDIAVTAYSPVAKGQDLHLPIIQELAKKYQRSASQVILNWLISKGLIAIPSSGAANHIEDNLRALEWALATEDVAKIDQLDRNNRLTQSSFAEFDR